MSAASRTLTWWTILRISTEERLVYRADFALATLLRFLPLVTHVLLWTAVFTAVKGQTINGLTYEHIVAYYLLVYISRAFSSMPNLAAGIALQIRNGEIKKFLIQPIDMMGFLLLTRIAHKLVYYAVALVPFAVVLTLCRGFFSGWPDSLTMGAYIASLVMGFLMGFFLEATIGMIGFWWLEVSSLLFLYMMLNFLLSGHMFPLDFLPKPWNSLIKAQPLYYLAGFPAEVFLGKIRGNALVLRLLIQLAWVIGLYVLSHLAFHFGVKRYSGFGG